jgi:hypothetical protein
MSREGQIIAGTIGGDCRLQHGPLSIHYAAGQFVVRLTGATVTLTPRDPDRAIVSVCPRPDGPLPYFLTAKEAQPPPVLLGPGGDFQEAWPADYGQAPKANP